MMTKLSYIKEQNFIPISKPSITIKEIDYVNDAIKSGWVSSIGKYIELFEKKFADYCGVKYALSTSNATVALHLSLVSLGIKEGDEVIVPEMTFIATANSAKYINAKVVPVDINENTLCIEPRHIESAINSKTKAVIPVHLYGHPADMIKINKVARKYNLCIVEDAAEALGAEIKGKKIGSFGNAAVFSFYGNKIITTGEGGMIITNDENLYNKMSFLRDHAMSKEKRYWHTEIGFNYRMTNLQAALGVAQLERIDELLYKRKLVFDWYEEELGDISGIKINYQAIWAKNIYWMICLEIENFNEIKRDEFIQKLKKYGIDSRPYFYPISDMPMYNNKKNITPISHKIYQRGLNLPIFFDITREQVSYICSIVKKELNVSKFL